MITLGPDTRVPECPNCKQKLDRAFNVGGENTPAPGNVCLCTVCGNWMVFGPDLKLTKPSPQMLAAIKQDRRCQVAYHAVMKLVRRRARRN